MSRCSWKTVQSRGAALQQEFLTGSAVGIRRPKDVAGGDSALFPPTSAEISVSSRCEQRHRPAAAIVGAVTVAHSGRARVTTRGACRR